MSGYRLAVNQIELTSYDKLIFWVVGSVRKTFLSQSVSNFNAKRSSMSKLVDSRSLPENGGFMEEKLLTGFVSQ